MEKTIRIYAKQVKTEKVNFLRFSYTKDGKKYYDVKFMQGSAMPTESGYWLLTVDLNDVNTAKGKKREGSKYEPNDVLWVKRAISLKKDVDFEKQRKEERLTALADLLD